MVALGIQQTSPAAGGHIAAGGHHGAVVGADVELVDSRPVEGYGAGDDEAADERRGPQIQSAIATSSP